MTQLKRFKTFIYYTSFGLFLVTGGVLLSHYLPLVTNEDVVFMWSLFIISAAVGLWLEFDTYLDKK